MTDPQEDAELDPAMERVRRKLVRLLAVSSAIMAVGLVAVLVAVIYRVSENAASPGPAVSVDLPVAAHDVRAATVGEGSLVLTIGGADPRIEVRRLSDGAALAVFRLRPGPAKTLDGGR